MQAGSQEALRKAGWRSCEEVQSWAGERPREDLGHLLQEGKKAAQPTRPPVRPQLGLFTVQISYTARGNTRKWFMVLCPPHSSSVCSQSPINTRCHKLQLAL